MGRHAKPHYYRSRDAWYVQMNGRQVLLARGRGSRKQATEAFERMLADGASPARRADLSVQVLCDLFATWSEPRVRPVTVRNHRERLQSFIDMYGGSRAADMRPLHVARWLESHPGWNDSTRCGYVSTLKAAFRWAARQGHLGESPLAHVERPAMGRREAVLSGEQAEKLIGHAHTPGFRDLLIGLWETGCRPGELATLEADRVDLDGATWRVVDKIRGKTGEPTRTVGLTRRALELSRRLLAARPSGLVFLNSRGNRWTAQAMACAFSALKGQLGYGPEVTAYAFRHAYATDALLKGVPVATVAAVMGHTSVATLMRHYNHLSDHPEHLREAARTIRPEIPSSDSGNPPPESTA